MLTWMSSEINPRPLGLSRIIVGAAALIRSIVALPVLSALTEPDTLRVSYSAWIPDPTMPLVVTVVTVWFVSAALFTIGWRVSLTGPLLVAAIVVTLFLDQQTYSNHLYLMAWLVLLMTIADAGAGLSVSRPDRPVVRWPVILIMLQMSVVYGFSAVTKINDRFLSGTTLAGVLRDGVIPFPEALRTPAFLSVLAGVVVVVELFIALMIWRPRFRPAAFILGLGLHVSIPLLMASTTELLVFSLEMLALYPLFLGDASLTVTTPMDSRWFDRIRRFNALQAVEIAPDPEVDDLVLDHRGRITRGADAHTRVLEHLVPWLWFAPLLRLPGVSQLHRRRHNIDVPVCAPSPQ